MFFFMIQCNVNVVIQLTSTNLDQVQKLFFFLGGGGYFSQLLCFSVYDTV